MNRKAILLNATDDVATALTALTHGEEVQAQLGDRVVDVVLRQDVPFGHKFALRDLAEGEDILKYGLPIGRAMEDIECGDWVHVHNCRSERFGHRHQKYGVNA
ncbi:UxaA family hydrolase [Candidatus Latescibacterota bacterium]